MSVDEEKSVKKIVKKTKKKTKKKPSKKTRSLVIVESPAKAKTINKILGRGYKVMASMGHLIDLPASKMGIDFENDFKPEYRVIKGRKKNLNALKKEAKASKAVFLAADPDREGEAICWHLKNEFVKDSENIFRVSFEEITEKAVKEAFENPCGIDENKVNAQQARRVLDRIMGYSLSPLLWKKITRGLSAGRVQSVALKLIVDRENEIRNFKPEEFWSIEAVLKKFDEAVKDPKDAESFTAKLVKYKEVKIEVTEKKTSDEILAELEQQDFIVKDVSYKDKKSYPRSPYTTSFLQQDAFNKINFSVSKTMRVAQSLYEGVEIGEGGGVGLITYMRTDSVRISDESQKEVRRYITSKYGNEYCPAVPPEYKAKKRAQEAHEAIRPTLPLRHPSSVSKYLSPDEYKLYNLIWKRFVASQMTNAIYSMLSVNIDAGDYRFKAGGGQLKFDGFLRVYKEDGLKETETPHIPSLAPEEKLNLEKLLPEQHFTKPPPRFTDASLVRTLEEKGIGRPSTYAPIIRTVVSRNYVKRNGRSLLPSELGELVHNLLIEHFSDIVNEEFTAKMEDELDTVEEGTEHWVKVVNDFYVPFSKRLEEAKKKMDTMKKIVIETNEKCEKCGRMMIIKWGRRGKFLSCAGFPECRNSKSITTGIKCPEEGCDGELIERKSSRGAFFGCSKFPDCTYTSRTLPKSEDADTENPNGAVEEE